MIYNFLHHQQYRIYRRLILISPGLMLLYIHLPYSILTVTGPSMSPFLNPNDSDAVPAKDQILVQTWNPKAGGQAQKAEKGSAPEAERVTEFLRGQIVTFAAPHDPNKVAVKRIVAIPGDMVQPLPGYPGGDEPVIVPWNHLWVEGDADSRAKSLDSNWYGPISQNLILGEVKAVWSSWWNWSWIDWKSHSWPARQKGRVEENAMMEAVVDPDVVDRNNGWTNGSIALILEQIRRQPEQMLYKFVNDPQLRQETRRLYNNALYVTGVANSEREKTLAQNVVKEMESLYGRETLVFGIRLKKRRRERGDVPDPDNSHTGEKAVKDPNALEAEHWLKSQGWELEKNSDGTVKTRESK